MLPGSRKYHSTCRVQDNVGNAPSKEHHNIPCQGPCYTHSSGAEKMILGNKPRKSPGRYCKETEDT
eukprot:10460695-Ditylum_brightwellii.AAC.1